MLAPGYPQSAPVSWSAPAALTAGDPAVTEGSLPQGDLFGTLWKTDKSWRGCRELILKLVDGSYHQAVFDFVR